MTGLTKTVGLDIPAHIDPARVVDFDFFHDARYEKAANPYDALIGLRDEVGLGIYWSPRNGGHWFITDHEMLFEAARRPEIFSSVHASFPPVPVEQEAFYPPINTDPPEHAKYRMPLMRAFAPRKVDALATDIRSFTAELIEGVARDGRCDFLEAIAEPLPITIFMKMMGLDLARYREFREWVAWMTQNDVDNRTAAYRNIAAMARPLIEERRINPKDDLLGDLVSAQIDGRPFTTDELEGICILLLGAGLDTVVNSLSFSMEYLARNPALQDRLRADPALIPEAVEELLRRFSVVFPVRRVARDSDFHGVTLKQGERVGLYLALGNLDPTAFPDASRFDLDREDKAHMTFISGPHRCVGSHLARIEMITFFEEWLKRLPNVRVDPASPPRYRTGIVFAVTSLPILWDATAIR
jgi:cytochrome P450